MEYGKKSCIPINKNGYISKVFCQNSIFNKIYWDSRGSTNDDLRLTLGSVFQVILRSTLIFLMETLIYFSS